jgi:hypothetical protein
MIWNLNAQAALLNRAPLIRRWLFWASARNRATNEIETIGIWDGDDHENFSPAGVNRLYLGAGGLFEVSPLIHSVGTTIQTQDVKLSGISQAAEQLIRGYEPRLAPCDLYLALFDPASLDLIGMSRMFNGVIDGAPIMTGAANQGSTATIRMVSAARNGTRKAAAKKSDEQQRQRKGDRFRRYADVSGTSDDWWGAMNPGSSNKSNKSPIDKAFRR